MEKRKEAQSTIEYILLVAALVALLIVFLVPSGSFHNMIKDKITDSIGQIQTMTDGTDFSTGDYTPSGGGGGGGGGSVNCGDYNESTCCAQEGCLLKTFYHLNSITYTCISEDDFSQCNDYSLASCCCHAEAGYNGLVPACAQ